jgi:hypothetical protein
MGDYIYIYTFTVSINTVSNVCCCRPFPIEQFTANRLLNATLQRKPKLSLSSQAQVNTPMAPGSEKKNKHPRLKQTSGVWSSPKVVEIWDVSSPSIYNGSPLFWIKQSHTNPLGLLHTTRDSAIFTLQDIHHPRGVAARFKMDHSRVPDDGYVRYQ